MMRRRWGVWLLLGLVLSAMPAAALEEPRRVRVGAFNFYPALFLDDDGVVKGFYVDMLAEIAARENWQIEYVYGSWNEGLQRLREGRADVLTSVAFTEERAGFMDYGRIPLLTVWGELYVPADAVLLSLKEVEGKKIAIMAGDFNARHFIDLVQKFGLNCEFLEMANYSQVFAAVQQGRADAGVANAVFGGSKQQQYQLRATGIVFNPFDIYFTVAKGRHAELLATFDRYLEAWRANEHSTYYQARLKWGSVQDDAKKNVPGWVYHGALGAIVLLGAGLVFILLLRRQVRKATRVVVEQRETLRENHEAYLSILSTAHDGFWLTDIQGALLDVNETYARQSGYRREELVGMSICQLEGSESQEEFLGHVEAVRKAGSDLFESVHRRKDGSRWDVEVSCQYSPSRGGRMFVFLRDISERKQAETALRKKSAEIERLLYTVSHDLRSPLVTMQTFLGFLRQDQQTADLERIAADMGYLEGAAQKMDKLLDELLRMSRIGRVSNAPVRVGFTEIIEEALAAVAGRLAEGRIEVRVTGENPLLYGDRARLAQLWQNLLDNAAKYMGGQAEPRIDVGSSGAGHERIYYVRDNGLGIAAEDAERIFGLFEKIDQGSAGSGLGLAMVKRIVELYQGRIWVKSAGPGQGSCFMFTLPHAAVGTTGETENDG